MKGTWGHVQESSCAMMWKDIGFPAFPLKTNPMIFNFVRTHTGFPIEIRVEVSQRSSIQYLGFSRETHGFRWIFPTPKFGGYGSSFQWFTISMVFHHHHHQNHNFPSLNCHLSSIFQFTHFWSSFGDFKPFLVTFWGWPTFYLNHADNFPGYVIVLGDFSLALAQKYGVHISKEECMAALVGLICVPLSCAPSLGFLRHRNPWFNMGESFLRNSIISHPQTHYKWVV